MGHNQYLTAAPILDLPWPGHTPTLHNTIGGKDDRYSRQLLKSIKDSRTTHLVREVRVGYVGDYFNTPHPEEPLNDYTRLFLESMIARAETEYGKLNRVGINVAPHEYAIAEDTSGRLRTLARVAIIEGQNYSTEGSGLRAQLRARRSNITDQQRSKLGAAIDTYISATSHYNRLAGVTAGNLSDFVYGIPRIEQGPSLTPGVMPDIEQPLCFLVDIEPLFSERTV